MTRGSQINQDAWYEAHPQMAVPPPGTWRVTVHDDGTVEGPVRMRQAFRTASGKKKRSELWDTKMWVDDEDGARG